MAITSLFIKCLLKLIFHSAIIYSDNLYILGDVVDKGDENLCLLNFIRGSKNMILIKGNHEYLFERYLQGIISAELWDACGGYNTRKEVEQLPENIKTGCLAFFEESSDL